MIYQVHISKGINDHMDVDKIYEAPHLLRSDIGDCLFYGSTLDKKTGKEGPPIMVEIIVDAPTEWDAECMALFNARSILKDKTWGENRLTNDECQP